MRNFPNFGKIYKEKGSYFKGTYFNLKCTRKEKKATESFSLYKISQTLK